MMPRPHTFGGDLMIELTTEGKMASTAGHSLALRTLANPPSNPYELLDIIGLLDQVMQENMRLWDEAEEIRAAWSAKYGKGGAARLREERKRNG